MDGTLLDFPGITTTTTCSVWRSAQKPNRLFLTDSDYPEWTKIEEKLQSLINLEKGWDGYDAEGVSFSNAHFAAKVLEAILLSNTPLPQIVPGTNGDLQIEWHTENLEIELHVISPYEVDAWISNRDTDEDGEEHRFTSDYAPLMVFINQLSDDAVDQAAAV